MLLFFFNDTATTEIYTLSLHDALPISHHSAQKSTSTGLSLPSTSLAKLVSVTVTVLPAMGRSPLCRLAEVPRSEEHTSELQSRQYLVCRLLLEKKKKKDDTSIK